MVDHGADGAAARLALAQHDEGSGKLDELQAPVDDRDTAQRGPERILRIEVADGEMDVAHGATPLSLGAESCASTGTAGGAGQQEKIQ